MRVRSSERVIDLPSPLEVGYINPEELLANSVGKDVRLMLKDNKVVRGEVISQSGVGVTVKTAGDIPLVLEVRFNDINKVYFRDK